MVFLEGITLYNIEYYDEHDNGKKKGATFKGSYKGFCFRIFKEKKEDDSSVLKLVIWKGPYILEKTDEEPTYEEFEFSDEGLAMLDEWVDRFVEKEGDKDANTL